MGTRYLADIMETIGDYVDGLKFAGGSFVLMPRTPVREINDLAHMHGAYVSTGGFIEHILTHESPAMVERHLGECQALDFDYVELSTGFISRPVDDLTALVKAVSRAGLRPKPELGIQFGAGGATSSGEGTRDVRWLIVQAKRCRDAGAPLIMIESEGITESVTIWRTDVVAAIMDELDPEQVMFEAADPDVFEWYIKNYGPEVNLFRRPQPGGAACVPARRSLGDQEQLGAHRQLQALTARGTGIRNNSAGARLNRKRHAGGA
jgi:phosphosulfolactate synthase (CoM biosynthesis protein A)